MRHLTSSPPPERSIAASISRSPWPKSAGVEFVDSTAATHWKSALRHRYPSPGGRIEFPDLGEPFVLSLPYTGVAYADHVMTNTNQVLCRGYFAPKTRNAV